MVSVPAIYGLACADALGSERVPAAVEAMARAGVEWIQLRLKASADDGRLDDRTRCVVIEKSLQRLDAVDRTGPRPVVLWMDDRADLARVFGLGGVHVGRRDLPPAAVRAVVGDDVLIGRSCHDTEQVREAEADPAVDVVAIGPVFPTRSKAAPDPVVGLDGVAAARRATGKPLVAIGGIDAERAGRALDAGADSLAVLGALCRPGDGSSVDAGGVVERARRLLEVAR